MAADPTASPAPSTTRRQIAHQADGPLAGNGKALHLPVHLLGKLAVRNPPLHAQWRDADFDVHPLFVPVDGGIAAWERA